MSDTRRHCDPEWTPGVLAFDELFPEVKSRKHQEKDRPSRQAKRRYRKEFHSDFPGKDRYQRLQDIDKMRLREALGNS